MSTQVSIPAKPPLLLPDVPALSVRARDAVILSTDGELKTLPHAKAPGLIEKSPPLVCHGPYTAQRLGIKTFPAFDVLELFAFVHPAQFCVPTPVGLAKKLGLNAPASFEDYPPTLIDIARALLTDLQNDPWRARADPLKIAAVMGRQGTGWLWTPFVFAALGQVYDPATPVISKADLNIWKHLPEWAEEAPPPPPSQHGVSKEEAKERLARMLGPDAETREQQADYAALLAEAFAPVEKEGQPRSVLAEAGTGVGKTLGYLAPASVWAEKNQGSVWISTFTKNLQRQIHQELDRLYPDPELKEAKVAVRKGRENYLCLLNLEDAAAGAALSHDPLQAVALGIMTRWAAATQNGDMQGGDFPGWLLSLLGPRYTAGLADRRGECIYSACDHYHRCFVEKAVRKSKHAQIVVANHALVMIQTADSGVDSDLPQRYIFDEGHHLFDAADSAFAQHLTARETYELRRWLRGVESGKRSRARGLKRRAEDLIAGSAADEHLLQDILEAARCLTADGWTTRLKENAPKGETETFIAGLYAQVLARSNERDGPHSIETETRPLARDLLEEAKKLKSALSKLQKPMLKLSASLRKRLGEQADTLDADTRRRIDVLCTAMGLKTLTITAWILMLETLEKDETPEEFVDWMEIERTHGRTWDIGLYRHWVNPIAPFAAALRPHAHGIAVTSATLRDNGAKEDADNWSVAKERTGLVHLGEHVLTRHFRSPFHYAAQTRIFVITDVNKNDLAQVSSAYRTLFEAAGGGALGLFTAISRLRVVQEKIAVKLEEHGLNLYAQHVDTIDNGTLVDIFRDDTHACLLGTDAVRDGVDVPGESLRLIVFDRVPWPRPTILHKARRECFGKKNYDDMTTRLKLKQAYGRLIRRKTDKGVFVMLDSGLPSRLHGAFPETVPVQRLGLAEAAKEIKKFLG